MSYAHLLARLKGTAPFEKNTCYMPVFGEKRYMIQEIKRAWLGEATVDGMQPGRGGLQHRSV